MDKEPIAQDRKLIPRWRSLSRTPGNERQSSRKPTKEGLDGAHATASAIDRWRLTKSPYDGAEVIYGAALFGTSPEVREVANELLNTGDLRPSLNLLCQSILGIAPEKGIATEQLVIGRSRARLAQNPRDALTRSEMALSYVTIGQKDSAKRAMATALGLAPLNRVILRAATRLHVHVGEHDRALSIISAAKNSGDPWLLSALVGASDLAGDLRHIHPKRLRASLDSQFEPEHLVELAAALASLELNDGNVKRAKKLISPFQGHLNENVAAQLRWLEANHKVSFGLDLLSVKDSFEATALAYFDEMKWRESVENSIRWHGDERFSARAAIHGSYVTSTYLKDYKESIRFVDLALGANPRNVTLLNNKAYGLSELGQLDQATDLIQLALSIQGTEVRDVVLEATAAHIEMRKGFLASGIGKYMSAIEEASNKGLVDTRVRMIIYLLREAVRGGVEFSQDELEKISNRFSEKSGVRKETRELYRTLFLEELKIRNENDLFFSGIDANIFFPGLMN